ncbi:MAG: GNAT family N-acetyltransferase [Paludibacteraceae bacterium]|nr:GNAT family N-acetyltransferase [Paludibacteraceae bacterium]
MILHTINFNNFNTDILRKFYDEVYSLLPNHRTLEELGLNICTEIKEATCNALVVEDESTGEIICGMVYDYFLDISCCCIESICVKESYRNNGVGKELYASLLETIPLEYTYYIFVELDSYDTNVFWKSLNYKKINFNYIGNVDNDVDLCCYPLPISKSDKYVSKWVLEEFVQRYLKYFMGVENPSETDKYKKMFNGCGEFSSITPLQ